MYAGCSGRSGVGRSASVTSCEGSPVTAAAVSALSIRRSGAAVSGSPAAPADVVTTSVGAASATRWAIRSAGYAGSTGR